MRRSAIAAAGRRERKERGMMDRGELGEGWKGRRGFYAKLLGVLCKNDEGIDSSLVR
jgi:hypothetical protein